MKALYKGIINVLIFFFVVDLFESILTIGNGTFYEKLVYGIIFSGIMYLVPHVLLFFKVTVTDASELLIASIFSFLYFFLGYYILSFIDLSGFVFNPRIPLIEPINFSDKSVLLLFIGIITAVMSVGISSLNKKRKRSTSYA